MKKQMKKQLNLKTESIRELTSDKLPEVVGGYATFTCSMSPTGCHTGCTYIP